MNTEFFAEAFPETAGGLVTVQFNPPLVVFASQYAFPTPFGGSLSIIPICGLLLENTIPLIKPAVKRSSFHGK